MGLSKNIYLHVDNLLTDIIYFDKISIVSSLRRKTLGKIVSISNQKGGVGKTTTCINLSAFIAAMGKKVLVVDIDPQGNTTSGFGISKDKELRNSIYEVMMGDATAEEAIRKSSLPNLDIIPSTIEFAGADVELMAVENREKVLRKALSQVREKYDFIFIDCPPSLNVFSVNAMTASDSVLIPIMGDFFSLEGLSQLLNTIKLVKKRLNPGLDIEGVVLTIYDGRSNLAIQVTADVEKWFGRSVYKTRIPRNVRLSEAPSHGLTILQYDPSSKGSTAYMNLAVEFLRRNGYKNAQPLKDLSAFKVKIK